MNCASSRTLSLRIGGVTLNVCSDDPRLNLYTHGSARGFLVSDGPADVQVRVGYGDLRGLTEGPALFDSGALWKVYRKACEQGNPPQSSAIGAHPGLSPPKTILERGANYLFRFTSPAYGAIPYKQACFTPEFTAGEVLLHHDYFSHNRPLDPLEYPLDELLMMNLLAQGRGVEVHACGVEGPDGRGYLFVGHSGAGKTTMARLWETAGVTRILSDDRIILRRLEGQIWMYGTPWHGEAQLASAARAPLSRIFLLEQRPGNGLVPLARPAAVARLMACSFVPFDNPSGLDFALAFYQNLTEVIPCCELEFAPDSQVVEFVTQN
jgi:hypothetical protein